MSKIGEILAASPSNWGRWGDTDEIGTLNFLEPPDVFRAMASIKYGQVLTLGHRIGDPQGDLMSLRRRPTEHYMVRDRAMYLAGKQEAIEGSGGVEFSDDVVHMYPQGTTQIDALGHVWYDGVLYNGYDAMTTTGGLSKNSIHHVATRSIVSRGVLLDVARHQGVSQLNPGAEVTLDDLLETARAEGVAIHPHDILVVRTGFYLRYQEGGTKAYFANGLNEPGITYTPALAQWFYDQEIVAYGTDTIGSEQTRSSYTGTVQPLHPFFITRLGLSLLELLWLEDWAEACQADGHYEGLMAIAPLKLVGGAGSPINPIVIR